MKTLHWEVYNNDILGDSVSKGDILFKILKQCSSFHNILSKYPMDKNLQTWFISKRRLITKSKINLKEPYLQSSTKYSRQTLVFMGNSAVRESSISVFQEIFTTVS